MYRTLEHMSIRGPDGRDLDLKPNDIVVGFEEWPPWTKHVMLDEKRVRWAPDGISDHELALARPTGPARNPPSPIPLVPQGLQPIGTDGEPHGTFDEPRPIGGRPAMSVEQEMARAPVAPADVSPDEARQFMQGAERELAAADADPLQCDVCSRTGFKDANGLKIHKTRAHKAV